MVGYSTVDKYQTEKLFVLLINILNTLIAC